MAPKLQSEELVGCQSVTLLRPSQFAKAPYCALLSAQPRPAAGRATPRVARAAVRPAAPVRLGRGGGPPGLISPNGVLPCSRARQAPAPGSMLDPHDDTDVPSGSTDGALMENTSFHVPRLERQSSCTVLPALRSPCVCFPPRSVDPVAGLRGPRLLDLRIGGARRHVCNSRARPELRIAVLVRRLRTQFLPPDLCLFPWPGCIPVPPRVAELDGVLTC